MTSFNNFPENHIFEDKIRDYEKELVKFSLEIGKRRGQNPIITKIFAYLLIHKALTQKELVELCECSIGSISTHLAAMISFDFVEKRLIPGTHTYIYSLNIDLSQNLSSTIKLGIKFITQAHKFLKSKKKELIQLLKKEKEKLNPIIKRFEEVESVILLYEQLFELFNRPNSDFIFEIKIYNSNDLELIQEFNPEVKAFENDIIDFFTYTPMFFGKQELFSKTFAYFITRKTLNQRKLKELTGLSSGKISQEIHTLLDLGIIEIINISETGLITYQMKSVFSAFLNISSNILSEYMKWKNKLEEIYLELENQKENLENLKGYKEIVAVVHIFMEIMPFYERIYHEVLNTKKKYNIS
jgi:DNA-binding transcriptional regulator GbsR (MarR family)